MGQAQSASAAESQHGKIPEKYELVEKLGQGGFGIVYKIRDNQGKFYAMKKMTLIKDSELEDANKEAGMLEKLKHPRIVDYFGHKFTSDGNFLIFMEFMVGGSLRSRITKEGKPFVEKTVIQYTHQILEGLTYVHGQVITHGDLKCDNLLLDDQNNVKLGDFGIAIKKLLSTAGSQGHSVFFTDPHVGGTPFWVAPEVIKPGGAGLGRRADLWSLGCTIVEMLTGTPPYYKKYNVNQFMNMLGSQSLKYDPEELVPSASKAMKQFLRLLLQYDPAKRPNDAGVATAKFKQLF